MLGQCDGKPRISCCRDHSGGIGQRSEWDFDSTADHDENDAAQPKSPEASVDQFGIRTALLVLCIASFIAAVMASEQVKF
jgi:hypothetical protein